MKQKKPLVYPELEKNIRTRNIRKKEIAGKLWLDPKSLSRKLHGSRGFYIDEAIIIQQTWFSDIPIEILFRRDDI